MWPDQSISCHYATVTVKEPYNHSQPSPHSLAWRIFVDYADDVALLAKMIEVQ